MERTHRSMDSLSTSQYAQYPARQFMFIEIKCKDRNTIRGGFRGRRKRNQIGGFHGSTLQSWRAGRSLPSSEAVLAGP
jgi:hypothetical protein